MKKYAKSAAIIIIAVLIADMIAQSAVAVNEEYGAQAVDENQSYTLEQMLNHAIWDEYLSMTKYYYFIQKFGRVRPLTNIANSERAHAAILKPIFSKYGFPIPENEAAQYVEIPGTLLEAFYNSSAAEKRTAEMYGIFLRQELPEDVKIVFTVLRTAANNHVKAFERAISRREGREL